jgi:hypothetical protein
MVRGSAGSGGDTTKECAPGTSELRGVVLVEGRSQGRDHHPPDAADWLPVGRTRLPGVGTALCADHPSIVGAVGENETWVASQPRTLTFAAMLVHLTNTRRTCLSRRSA